MGEESGRGSGRVRLFVGNRGSGRVKVSPGRVGSKKSDPWTTLTVWFSISGILINKMMYMERREALTGDGEACHAWNEY